jgi:hypothetical protein
MKVSNDGGGSLESSGWFCVGAFGRNLASVDVKMFSHLIYLLINVINFVLSMRYAKMILLLLLHRSESFLRN